jgi:hypothetical protein
VAGTSVPDSIAWISICRFLCYQEELEPELKRRTELAEVFRQHMSYSIRCTLVQGTLAWHLLSLYFATIPFFFESQIAVVSFASFIAKGVI